MRKRGATIQHRSKGMPGLIVQFIAQDYEIRLRSSVDAFRLNYAEATHYNDLSDCVDLMTIADATGYAKKDDGAMGVAKLAAVALWNIKVRFDEHGKFGATGDEMRALELLANTSLDYWSRRSGALYSYAYQKLKIIRAHQAKESEVETH